MNLTKIDKQRYRQHLNKVIIACIIVFAALSLGFAQILIVLFPDPSGRHFHWNLLGLILAVLIVGMLLKHYKTHDYMTEVVYVWELKKILNRITRKMPAIQKAATQGDIKAMLALQYSYSGSRLLWELDDNTIVMDELAIEQSKLDSLLSQYKINLNLDDFDPAALDNF